MNPQTFGRYPVNSHQPARFLIAVSTVFQRLPYDSGTVVVGGLLHHLTPTLLR